MSAIIRRATLDDWRAAVEMVAVEVRKDKQNLDKAEQACNELPGILIEKINSSKVVVAEYNGRLVGVAVDAYTSANSEELKKRLAKSLKDLS